MKTFYHISQAPKRNSILEKGLLTGSRDKVEGWDILYENKLFLFSDPDDLAFYFIGGNDAVDIWEVKVPDEVEILKDPFAESDGHHTSWMIESNIPACNLKRIKTQWHPWEYEGDLNDPIPSEYL